MIALLLLQAATAAAPIGWKLADRTNAAGVRSVSASVVGVDGLSRLVVKCDVAAERIVSIQFIQPQPIGQSPDKLVAVRFDGGPAFRYVWQFPGTGAYVTDPEAITKLTSFAVKARTIDVETTNSSDFAVQARFAGAGSEAMIRQVLGICGYTLGVVPSAAVAAPSPAAPALPAKPAPMRRKPR